MCLSCLIPYYFKASYIDHSFFNPSFSNNILNNDFKHLGNLFSVLSSSVVSRFVPVIYASLGN